MAWHNKPDDDIQEKIKGQLEKNENGCYYILPIYEKDDHHWSLAIFGNINASMV